jgi:hypothetical protein
VRLSRKIILPTTSHIFKEPRKYSREAIYEYTMFTGVSYTIAKRSARPQDGLPQPLNALPPAQSP